MEGREDGEREARTVSRLGWMAYGNNKLMYSWGNAISNNGWPLFSGDLQQKAWQQALPQNVA